MDHAFEIEEKTGPYNAYRIQTKALHGMVDLGRTPREESEQGGVRIRTLQRWFKHWREFGETPEETKRWQLQRGLYRKKRITRMRPRRVQMLKSIVDAQPELYLDEMQEKLFTRYGELYALSTLSRTLRCTLRYSLRVIQEKAAQRDAEERAAFQLMARDLVPNADMWIYIDETHKGRNEARRRKAWAPRGRNNDISVHFCPDGARRYTMLAAADIDGFVLGACDVVEREHGDADTNEFRGTVDTERFLMWVRESLVPLLGRVSALEPRSVVLADNAPTHIDPRFEEMVRGAGALLLFLPPYSPDYNPIELAFHQCVGKTCLAAPSRGRCTRPAPTSPHGEYAGTRRASVATPSYAVRIGAVRTCLLSTP